MELKKAETTTKFCVGDYAISLNDVSFMDGSNHIRGGIYLVTEETLHYYNVCQEEYEKLV